MEVEPADAKETRSDIIQKELEDVKALEETDPSAAVKQYKGIIALGRAAGVVSECV
jgi:hypothetical protein